MKQVSFLAKVAETVPIEARTKTPTMKKVLILISDGVPQLPFCNTKSMSAKLCQSGCWLLFFLTLVLGFLCLVVQIVIWLSIATYNCTHTYTNWKCLDFCALRNSTCVSEGELGIDVGNICLLMKRVVLPISMVGSFLLYIGIYMGWRSQKFISLHVQVVGLIATFDLLMALADFFRANSAFQSIILCRFLSFVFFWSSLGSTGSIALLALMLFMLVRYPENYFRKMHNGINPFKWLTLTTYFLYPLLSCLLVILGGGSLGVWDCEISVMHEYILYIGLPYVIVSFSLFVYVVYALVWGFWRLESILENRVLSLFMKLTLGLLLSRSGNLLRLTHINSPHVEVSLLLLGCLLVSSDGFWNACIWGSLVLSSYRKPLTQMGDDDSRSRTSTVESLGLYSSMGLGETSLSSIASFDLDTELNSQSFRTLDAPSNVKIFTHVKKLRSRSAL